MNPGVFWQLTNPPSPQAEPTATPGSPLPVLQVQEGPRGRRAGPTRGRRRDLLCPSCWFRRDPGGAGPIPRSARTTPVSHLPALQIQRIPRGRRSHSQIDAGDAGISSACARSSGPGETPGAPVQPPTTLSPLSSRRPHPNGERTTLKVIIEPAWNF